jgi:ATP-binding cassette subfamily B protein RaxB
MRIPELPRCAWLRSVPDIRQAEAAECGLACLGMVAWYHGHETDLGSLRRRYPVSLKGMTLAGLMAAAERLGLAGRPLRLELGKLKELRLPAILHWDMSHFVVLRRVHRDGSIVIQDPARGERKLDPIEISKHFTGVALELTPTTEFEPGTRVPPRGWPTCLDPRAGSDHPCCRRSYCR